MKVLSTKGETIGHDTEALAKILAREMAKEAMLSLEAEVTGSPRDSMKENGYSAYRRNDLKKLSAQEN